MSPRGELLLINLLCFGPFAWWAIAGLIERKTTLLFDDRRALFFIGIELVAGTTAILILRARGWKFGDFGLRITMPQTIAGMVLLIGANLFIAGFVELVRVLTNSDPASATTAKTTITWPVLIALTLINPLYDELFSVAYNVRAAEGTSAAFAITLSAVIRFICHLEQGPIAAVTILPLGLIFAFVYWRWRMLWPLVVAHGVMDFAGMIPA
jgi:membrane protease YdiL (CAAX protease family)